MSLECIASCAARTVGPGREFRLRTSPLLAQWLLPRLFDGRRRGAIHGEETRVDLHDRVLPGVSLAADRIVAAVQAGRQVTVWRL